ncbi:hypothetical protein OXX80_006902 [Metschnikowia pulcherrima]
MASRDVLTAKLIGTVATVCMGSLQFGYHMAEMNSPGEILSCKTNAPGAVPYESSFFGRKGFSPCIPLTNEQVGLATSIFSIGGLVGSFYAGSLADSLGRKKTALLHNVFFFMGSFLNGFSGSLNLLLLGRFLAGVGAGSALVVTSITINEIAPPSYKGFLGSMNQVSINIGILLTQLLALRWNNNNDWRYLLFMGSALSSFNFGGILMYGEESPLWLFNNGMATQAFTTLHKLRGGEYATARNEVNSWRQSNGNNNTEDGSLLREEGVDTATSANDDDNNRVSLKQYLKSPEYNNSKLVGTGILVLQQFCGINSIVFYGVSVLINIFPDAAVLINCFISIVNTVVTFASAPFVDKLGRKPLLKTSVSMMGLSAAILGYGISSSNAVLSIIGTFTYITFFAVGLGPIPFLLVGEVTQTEAKASAQSWGVTMNWLATFVVGYTFPVLKETRLGAGVYYIFSGMCAYSYYFIKKHIPETKGRHTYEEVWALR